MKITIVYFSQTGSTEKVAEAAAEACSAKGHAANTVALRNATAEDVLGADLVGVGAPSFASHAPTPVKEFVQALPPLTGRRGFVLTTSAVMPGRVMSDIATLLEDRGAEVVGGFATRGICLHAAPCFKGREKLSWPNQTHLDRARSFAAALIDHVEAGRPGPVPAGSPEALRRRLGFYDVVGTILTDPVVRFVLPKPVVIANLCNDCSWCADECPTNAISLSPKPTVGKRCIRCYRCMTGCPQEAMRVTSWLFGNTMTWLVYNSLFSTWFGNLRPEDGEKLFESRP